MSPGKATIIWKMQVKQTQQKRLKTKGKDPFTNKGFWL